MGFPSDVIQILRHSESIDTMAREAMNCHASCYRDNLRLSHLQAELMPSLGGEEHVKILISECVLFQLILQEEFGRRHLAPLGSPAPIVPSEEAWEFTSLKVKQYWGMVPA